MIAKNKFTQKLTALAPDNTQAEELNLAAETEKDESELRRGKKHAVHGVWVGLVWVLGIVSIALLLVVAWHLLAPPCCHWLSEEHVQFLTNSFVSALIGYMAHSVQKFI